MTKELDTEFGLTRANRLRAKPWNNGDVVFPAELFSVPSMLSNEERRMLYYLTLYEYSGEGAIADLGAFLGGSTICFAAALQQRFPDMRKIHSYDLFKLGDYERKQYFPSNAPADLKTRQLFDRYLSAYSHLIDTHEGDILGFPWDGGPLEFMFVDIAKSYKVFDHLLLSYFPALMPGRSLIIMQDYLWGSTGPWHQVVMEKLADYFDYLVDTTVNSVVFSLKKAIPRSQLEQCRWINIDRVEKLALMDSAIEKLDTEEKKAFLREAREFIVDGRDLYWGMHYHKL